MVMGDKRNGKDTAIFKTSSGCVPSTDPTWELTQMSILA